MKPVLLYVLLGAVSGARLLSESNAAETVIYSFSDTSCSTRIDVSGLMVTSADLSDECTPPQGECFTITPACETVIAALGGLPWYATNTKAVKIWWSDLPGRPCSGSFCGGAIPGIIAGVASVLIMLFLWLSGALAPKTGPIPGCPSPLPEKYVLFKCKPKSKTPADGVTSAQV